MKFIIRPVLLFVVVACAGDVAHTQTPGTKNVMREKLMHSQKILESILSSSFPLLESETDALAKATEAPAWKALQGPEYAKQSEAFLKALGELRAAAKARDLDAAAEHYNELTTSCFACHRHVKNRRLADR